MIFYKYICVSEFEIVYRISREETVDQLRRHRILMEVKETTFNNWPRLILTFKRIATTNYCFLKHHHLLDHLGYVYDNDNWPQCEIILNTKQEHFRSKNILRLFFTKISLGILNEKIKYLGIKMNTIA
ncbi:hypothetical protein BpHYR1_035733 [Brachionus plicatilis]|uniref:Uncharacterized protein n=1 Tax=Brachionus plicatilis TaxID=10195 RepID=A0A3M7SYN0_BRAPC|nr:hypothetical protein BpHYR1_035733 [Brachionus plicatilis]